MHRAILAVAFLSAGPVFAADSIVGVLTVDGKATPLRSVVASIQHESDKRWLVVLASDVAVAEADRTPTRLAALAAAGKVRAVRVVWEESSDFVRASPYYPSLAQSGLVGGEHPTIDLERYDDERFEGTFKSKMLGQNWFFEAHVKTTLTAGGAFEMESEMAEANAPDGGATQPKVALGRLGYEYTVDMFERAVLDASVEGVGLFLVAGMSPNTPAKPDRQPLALAALGCAYGHEPQAAEMVSLLLKAGAKVDGGARDGITPLLHAAQYCSGPEVVLALVAAGANVNTKAPGGATPLMLAKVSNHPVVETVLVGAGARD